MSLHAADVRVSAALLLAAMAPLLFGCEKPGPPLVDVSGQVTLDGAPLAGAVVSFVSADGKLASARLDDDGHYHLRSQFGAGATVGDYRVTILPAPQTDAKDREQMLGTGKRNPASSAIPERYQRVELSGLDAVVDPGHPAVFNFELTTP